MNVEYGDKIAKRFDKILDLEDLECHAKGVHFLLWHKDSLREFKERVM